MLRIQLYIPNSEEHRISFLEGYDFLDTRKPHLLPKTITDVGKTHIIKEQFTLERLDDFDFWKHETGELLVIIDDSKQKSDAEVWIVDRHFLKRLF